MDNLSKRMQEACMLLELDKDTSKLTLPTLKEAYKRAAKKTHPDSNVHVDHDASTAAFQAVGQAYELLYNRLQGSFTDDPIFFGVEITGGKALSDEMREEMKKWEEQFHAETSPELTADLQQILGSIDGWHLAVEQHYRSDTPSFGPRSALNCDKCGKTFEKANELQAHDESVHDPLNKFLEQAGALLQNMEPQDVVGRPLPYGWAGKAKDPTELLNETMTPQLEELFGCLATWDRIEEPAQATDTSKGVENLVAAVRRAQEELRHCASLQVVTEEVPSNFEAWYSWYKSTFDQLRLNCCSERSNDSEQFSSVLPVHEDSLKNTPSGASLPLPIPVVQVRSRPRQTNAWFCKKCWSLFPTIQCRICAESLCGRHAFVYEGPQLRFEPDYVCLNCLDDMVREVIEGWMGNLCLPETPCAAVEFFDAHPYDLWGSRYSRTAYSSYRVLEQAASEAANPGVAFLCLVRQNQERSRVFYGRGNRLDSYVS
eukprot:1043422-Rhodomonas_salina.1